MVNSPFAALLPVESSVMQTTKEFVFPKSQTVIPGSRSSPKLPWQEEIFNAVDRLRFVLMGPQSAYSLLQQLLDYSQSRITTSTKEF